MEVTWALVEEMAAGAATVLRPVFDRTGGRKGRLSIQTNPANYRNAHRMLEQGRRFARAKPWEEALEPLREQARVRAGHAQGFDQRGREELVAARLPGLAVAVRAEPVERAVADPVRQVWVELVGPV